MNDLFNDNIHLVYKLYNRYIDNKPKYFKEMYADDLLQEALLGLYSASMNYKPNDNNKFSTYAGVCIQRAMWNYTEKIARLRRKGEPMEIISYDEPMGKHETLADYIPCKEKQDISWIFNDNRLTPLQVQVCKLKYEGYTDQEIGDMLGFCRAYPNKILKQVGKILNEN